MGGGIVDSVRLRSDTVNAMRSGLDGLPSWAISPVRDVLATQGLPRESITDAGDIDAALLATSLIDTVTIRTNITPELTVDLRSIASGPSSPITRALQPTLVLKGRLIGTRMVAPHGNSQGGGLVFFSLAALLASIAYRTFRRPRSR